MRAVLSGAQDGARADSGGAVDLGEADPCRPGHLPVARVAAKLQGDLMHLPQAGGPDRLATRQAAAVGVDREAPADPVAPLWISVLLLPVLAETGLGEMHDLGARLGVLQLRDVDVIRSDAGLLERRGGRLGGRRRRRLDGIDGLKTSNEPKRRVRNATERR